jgi:hypothetical protein
MFHRSFIEFLIKEDKRDKILIGNSSFIIDLACQLQFIDHECLLDFVKEFDDDFIFGFRIFSFNNNIRDVKEREKLFIEDAFVPNASVEVHQKFPMFIELNFIKVKASLQILNINNLPFSKSR